MSKFISYQSFLYDTGGNPTDFKAQFKQHLVDAGWQVVEDLSLEFSVRPPNYEDIGNALGYEVIRFIFDNTKITLYPTIVNSAGSKKGFTISPTDDSSAYPNTYIQFGASASDRVVFNLPAQGSVNTNPAKAQAMYDALVASTNLEAKKYDYFLINDQGRQGISVSSTNIYIKAIAKIPGDLSAAEISVVGSGIVAPKPYSRGQLPGEIAKFIQISTTATYELLSISTPYTGGFVYYLSISARTIILCIKNASGIEGPIYGSYIDRQIALNQTPLGCTPCELFSGRLSNNTPHYYVAERSSNKLHNTNLYMARPTHIWGIPQSAPYQLTTTSVTGFALRSVYNDRATDKVEKIEDLSGYVFNVPTSIFDPVYALGSIYTTQAVYLARGQKGALPFDFTTVNFFGFMSDPSSASDEQQYLFPSGPIDDFYVAGRVYNNESLHLIADYNIQTYLTAIASPTDLVLTVNSTALLPAVGTIKVGLETISYTGKTATTLTGLTRAREGSVAVGYTINEPVILQFWIVVINKIGMRTGYVKPS